MMNKTTKQIADELKIDKQKVYRYIKRNHIKEVNQSESVKYYDEAVQKHIKQYFEANRSTSNETHQNTSKAHQSASSDIVLETLIEQLKEKDKQIAELQKLIDQEQQLRMAEHKRILELEDKVQQSEEEAQKKKWWKIKK